MQFFKQVVQGFNCCGDFNLRFAGLRRRSLVSFEFR
ncbi:hypothetical protein ES288_A06G128600v1 [Gossypium darwinii]|uniref:Uncharacterized protein n=1 Tax=Gossypium darwinii TaxID=34276 RepID=A0A5D2G4V2_GOSDA|nr:hypothetical protein ES288_A06G128600v1 [Gossypium darwinii]